MFIIISLSIIVAFFVSVLIVRWQIESFKHAGITGKDMHKKDEPLIPEMGGLSAIIGFIVGISILLANKKSMGDPVLLTAIIGIVGAGFIGMVDDMVTIRQRAKALLPYLFTLPFGVQMMGTSIDVFGFSISNPYVVLLLVPFGVTCAANASNMLEGFNGMGAGLSIIAATTMIILIYMKQTSEFGIFILYPLLGSVLGFGVYNIYPSRIFPGDTFTLFSGAAIGCAAIISDLIIPGIILFIPMILEFFLKFRGEFEAENFADTDDEGYLLSIHDKTESLTHILVKHVKLKEWQLVMVVWIMEIIIGSLIVLFFGIF